MGCYGSRMTAPAPDRVMTAIILRLGAALIFSVMNALIKLAEYGGANLGEVLFFRQLFALVPVLLWLATGPGFGAIKTRRFSAHLFRTALGLLSMSLMFATVLLLPLAEATTMQFTLPIFATILGALVLREPTGVHRWGAVVVGFAGVLIITRPGGVAHIPLLGAATGLTAALLAAGVSILLRQIGKTENAATTVFWFSTLSVPPLALVFFWTGSAHPAMTWIWLALVGLSGGCAQLLMTSSLRLGPVSLVVPMDYTGLVWATVLGQLLFQTLPNTATLIGAPVVVGSGLYILLREHRQQRRQIQQTRQTIA